MGKQIVFTSRQDYGDEMSSLIFARDSVWTEFGPVDNFTQFPKCTLQGGWNAHDGNITRVVCDSLIFGPFSDSSDQVVLPEGIRDFANCAFNFLCIDQASPKLQSGAVWSWDVGEPSTKMCGFLKSNGRWGTADCETFLPFACQSQTNPNDWVVDPSSKDKQLYPSCPTGYRFAAPSNGYQNQRLLQASGGTSVWLLIHNAS